MAARRRPRRLLDALLYRPQRDIPSCQYARRRRRNRIRRNPSPAEAVFWPINGLPARLIFIGEIALTGQPSAQESP
jgi:hypothetical protein